MSADEKTAIGESSAKPYDPLSLKLNAISLSFGDREVLHDITLELKEKRIGLIGRNGSGKSSLARLLNGLITPTKGEVTLDGVHVSQDRAEAIRLVGFIFQNPDHQIIFPTVGEEMAFGLEQQGFRRTDAQKQVSDLLESLDLENWLDRSIHELSQGQRHLVCLLSVLLMKPKVIVLDEPYAGLDLPTSRRLFSWLEGLDQHLITISHDLDLLSAYERVIWIEDGKVKADGKAEAVITRYQEAMEKEADKCWF